MGGYIGEEGITNPPEEPLYPEIDYVNVVQQRDAVMKLLLGNYIEHSIYAVLGLQTVYPFLHHCYAT